MPGPASICAAEDPSHGAPAFLAGRQPEYRLSAAIRTHHDPGIDDICIGRVDYQGMKEYPVDGQNGKPVSAPIDALVYPLRGADEERLWTIWTNHQAAHEPRGQAVIGRRPGPAAVRALLDTGLIVHAVKNIASERVGDQFGHFPMSLLDRRTGI